MKLANHTIQTPFGPVEALPTLEAFHSGGLRSCIAAKAGPLRTPFGEVVPQFTADTLRKRQLPCIIFHPNGMVRTLPLEEQAEVQTPLGPMHAELLTFYEDGALKRVFPLNGRLSGFWSQEDESKLARPMRIETPAGMVEAVVIAAYFSPQGALRSLTLWPGEVVDVPCPCGTVPARSGVAFYDSGAVRSVEPATPHPVPTPLGDILAFNPDCIGLCGDANSLRFRPDGAVLGLSTVDHAFEIVAKDGSRKRVAPPLRSNACDGETMEPAPLFLEFNRGLVTFTAEKMPGLTASVASVSPADNFAFLPRMEDLCTTRTAW